MLIPSMVVKESVSVSSQCSGPFQDSNTWFTNANGYLIGLDYFWACGTNNCRITLTQTFTVSGYGVLVMNQDGTITGSKNVITITTPNSPTNCTTIVITP
jgi:hypothetical protein